MPLARKILTIVGARPQFVKAATVSRALRAVPNVTEISVHTGQHFDTQMSEVFFRDLRIPKPHYNLDIHGGRHGTMTGRMMAALEPVVIQEMPDVVLVYGDTNSTLAGALVAAKLNLPVAHVEAGLRSFNRAMPEEVNRVITDHVSALLFCPTHVSIDNLRNEGVTRGVHHVGDVMYDATLYAKERATSESTILQDLGLRDGDYAIATLHRQENTSSPETLSRALDWLKTSAKPQPVVLPLHPRTQLAVENYGFHLDGIVGYPSCGHY